MTAPAYAPAPQYPVQPQQPAPVWPQQYPAQPAYPQVQQFAPGYPPAIAAAPAQPLAHGSIDDFYSQPSTGGGKSISWQGKPAGTTYTGIVTRPITSGDIQQQTDTVGRPQFFRDGRPKFVMKVPLQMQPSAEHPDGLAQWYVKGQARDELVRAMAEAGAPAGPPEAGAIIQVSLTGQRPSGAGMNPANVFHVIYTRPDGTTSSPAPQVQQPVAQPAPVQFAQPAPVAQAPAPVAQPVQYAQPAAAPAPVQPVQQPQAPAGMSAEQQALLARLTGQQAAQ